MFLVLLVVVIVALALDLFLIIVLFIHALVLVLSLLFHDFVLVVLPNDWRSSAGVQAAVVKIGRQRGP